MSGSPASATQTIQDVAAQRMALGYVGVVEIVRWILSHAELLHHAPGAQIRRDGHGDQFFEASHLERVADYFPSACGGQAARPILGRQAPANLHARSEMGLE